MNRILKGGGDSVAFMLRVTNPKSPVSAGGGGNFCSIQVSGNLVYISPVTRRLCRSGEGVHRQSTLHLPSVTLENGWLSTAVTETAVLKWNIGTYWRVWRFSLYVAKIICKKHTSLDVP